MTQVKREHVVTFHPAGRTVLEGAEIEWFVRQTKAGLDKLGYDDATGGFSIHVVQSGVGPQARQMIEVVYHDGDRIGLDSWERAALFGFTLTGTEGEVTARTRTRLVR